MIAPDTSVLIAGFDRRHPFFEQAETALLEVKRSGRLVAHTIAETFAVLSAPAGPYPATAADVTDYVEQFLASRPIGVAPAGYPAAIRELTAAGVAGGAVYDGLIALGARRAGAQLVSLDVRAARTYARVGVDVRLLAGH